MYQEIQWLIQLPSESLKVAVGLHNRFRLGDDFSAGGNEFTWYWYTSPNFLLVPLIRLITI